MRTVRGENDAFYAVFFIKFAGLVISRFPAFPVRSALRFCLLLPFGGQTLCLFAPFLRRNSFRFGTFLFGDALLFGAPFLGNAPFFGCDALLFLCGNYDT